MWKFYFWGVVIFYTVGFLSFANPEWIFVQWQGLVLTLPAILGLYSYAYKKPVLKPIHWKYITWFTFAVYAFYLSYIFFPMVRALLPSFLNPGPLLAIETVITLIFGLPMLYALDQLGNNSTHSH